MHRRSSVLIFLANTTRKSQFFQGQSTPIEPHLVLQDFLSPTNRCHICHVQDPRNSSIELEEVKYLGLSVFPVSTLRREHAIHPTPAIEVEGSPFSSSTPRVSARLLKSTRELGIRIIVYSPPLKRSHNWSLRKSIVSSNRGAPAEFPVEIPQQLQGRRFEQMNHGIFKGEFLIDLVWALTQGKHAAPIRGTVRLPVRLNPLQHPEVLPGGWILCRTSRRI